MTHLTDLGRLMQQHLSAMQAAADAAKHDAAGYGRLSGSRLKFGMFASFGAELLLGLVLLLPAPADALEEKIALCVSCHGEAGLPEDPGIPILWGQEFF